jgi:hypothetical protein
VPIAASAPTAPIAAPSVPIAREMPLARDVSPPPHSVPPHVPQHERDATTEALTRPIGDPDAETVVQPPRHAATANTIPPPPVPYTGSGDGEAPTSPWAAPPRPSDRD